MEIQIIKFDDLNPLVIKSEKTLLEGNLCSFTYPDNLIGNAYVEWEESIEVIKQMNNKLLSKIKNSANVYAIFVEERNGLWEPVYIGQRKASGIKERIIQHLIKKDKRTGSKLDNIKDCVNRGIGIGLKFIKVEPESMRLYIEEMLINNNKSRLKWNKHG